MLCSHLNKQQLSKSSERLLNAKVTRVVFLELCGKYPVSLNKKEFSFYFFSYKKSLQSLRIKEGHIAKVVPHRIFSMAFHPARYKTLVLAGDKWGNLGIWDVVRIR